MASKSATLALRISGSVIALLLGMMLTTYTLSVNKAHAKADAVAVDIVPMKVQIAEIAKAQEAYEKQTDRIQDSIDDVKDILLNRTP